MLILGGGCGGSVLKSCSKGGKNHTCIFCLKIFFFIVFKSVGFHLAAVFFLLIKSRREGR